MTRTGAALCLLAVMVAWYLWPRNAPSADTPALASSITMGLAATPSRPHRGAPPRPFTPPGGTGTVMLHQSAADAGASLEVTYDGRYYHFRQYRYERLEDALAYATAQRRKPGYRPDPSFVPQWQPEWMPDMAQRATMHDLDIGFGAGRFRVGPYRYDRLDDAVAFARMSRGRSEP